MAKPNPNMARNVRGEKNPRYKHGSWTKYPVEYSVWAGIKRRCFRKEEDSYHLYGGRGITMCDEWCVDFMAFYNHIGARPSDKHQIDRIDSNGHYEPGNVRWVTAKQQARNKRNNRLITFNGETLCLAEWAEKTGLSRNAIRFRIDRRGWSIEKALTTPSLRHG